MRYKIINGKEATQKLIKEAEKKFTWLKDADFLDAEIDIRNFYLIWKGGIWEGGVWKDGFWKDGIWEGGIWEGGVWKDGFWRSGVWEDGVWKDGFWEGGFWKNGFWKSGFWRSGQMWNNILQEYEYIKWNSKKRIFEVV